MLYTIPVKNKRKRRPIMKRKSILALILTLSLCLSLLLTSCEDNPCAHNFDSSCDPDCGLCGYTRTTGHVWKAATCFAPKTCRNCDITEGEALSHNFDPDCEDSDVCTNCYMVASALEHNPDENGICQICGQPVLATMSEE